MFMPPSSPLSASNVIASVGADAPVLTTPTLGTPTVISADPSVDVASYEQTHTRAAGAGLCVLIAMRSNANPSAMVTMSYGGEAMAIAAQDKVDGAGDMVIAVGCLGPGIGPTGSNTVSVTLTRDARDACGYIVDVIGTSGCPQGVADAVEDAGAATTSTTITPSNADSLILSLGAHIDATDRPTVGAGFSSVATTDNGGGSLGVGVILQSAAPGSTALLSVACAHASSNTDRSICAAEWLPG